MSCASAPEDCDLPRCSMVDSRLLLRNSMQIDEAYADSQAPNAGAIKNARGVVLKRKMVEVEKPRQVNTSALKKKIATQLEGIGLLESLVSDLIRAGLGTLNAKSARQIEEQARQLGNAYLTGAQNALHALTGLFYRSQIDRRRGNGRLAATSRIISRASARSFPKRFISSRARNAPIIGPSSSAWTKADRWPNRLSMAP